MRGQSRDFGRACRRQALRAVVRALSGATLRPFARTGSGLTADVRGRVGERTLAPRRKAGASSALTRTTACPQRASATPLTTRPLPPAKAGARVTGKDPAYRCFLAGIRGWGVKGPAVAGPFVMAADGPPRLHGRRDEEAVIAMGVAWAEPRVSSVTLGVSIGCLDSVSGLDAGVGCSRRARTRTRRGRAAVPRSRGRRAGPRRHRARSCARGGRPGSWSARCTRARATRRGRRPACRRPWAPGRPAARSRRACRRSWRWRAAGSRRPARRLRRGSGERGAGGESEDQGADAAVAAAMGLHGDLLWVVG